MKGPPLTLNIDPNAIPAAIHTPIPVPLHWQDEVKAGLDRDVRLGVLEPVPVGEPVTWCHRMVTCKKKNGKLRRTVDLQALNAYSTRETHHTQSPFHQATLIPSDKKKSVFDAWNGYHSVPIRECDRHYTAFITPWGRYRYRTTPQGYIASGDGYSRRFDEIVSEFPDKTKCIDDTCMWADNVEDSFFQACRWLDLCGHNGIIQNPDKFVFAEDAVEFAGFEITADNIKPCKKYLQAITDFPVPQNITDIRSWFGLINQVNYCASMTDDMKPFRDLLKPSTPFYWDTQLQQLFDQSKVSIIDEIKEGVVIFDKTKKTCLQTDWSKDGIGFWLLQKHCQCPGDRPDCCPSGWKITFAGSRFTHPAESRYAPVEGEALAVADALERAKHFVLGCDDLIIAVDHKPLLKILGDRKLEDIHNPRLMNLKEKTLPFKYKIIHIEGKKHKAPDAISRHPTGSRTPDKLSLTDDTLASIMTHEDDTSTEMEEAIMLAAASSLQSFQSVTWNSVREATTSDPIMQILLTTIEQGFPYHKHELPQQIQDYWQFRDSLSATDGVVTFKDRIVIPPSLRPDILEALHSAHQGVTAMSARADISVFWPGITKQISLLRARCNDCNIMAPSQPRAPPTPPQEPVYPFQCICSDYFHYAGTHYLIIVDRYSNWPIVQRSSGGAAGLIKCLRETFITYGIPDELASDGGPEYTSKETQHFLKSWGVSHRVSSVAFPHSNCRAELGVKTCKRMITNNTGPVGEIDTDRFQRAMLQYRNCPDQDTKLSPAMIVFGRAIKDFIPILPGRYKPHSTWIETGYDREKALMNRHMKAVERLTEHTQKLPELWVGDHVRVQNQTGTQPLKWDKTGKVVEVNQYDQYVIKADGSGRVTVRNRKFLRKFTPFTTVKKHTPYPISTLPIHQPPITNASPDHKHPTRNNPREDSHDPREDSHDPSKLPLMSPPHPSTPAHLPTRSSTPHLDRTTSPKPTARHLSFEGSQVGTQPEAHPEAQLPQAIELPQLPPTLIHEPAPSSAPSKDTSSPVLRRSTRERKPPTRYDPTIWNLK
jgi:hypothetical protein